MVGGMVASTAVKSAIVLFLFASWSYAANLTYYPSVINNPLKGCCGNPSHTQTNLDSFPHSLIFTYIPFRSIVNSNAGVYDWTAMETNISFATNDHGSQLIPRFYLDYPSRDTGIPQYLLDGGLQTWVYTDTGNQNGKSLWPNYEDANLHTFLTNFISTYGTKYDGDPRIAFVEIGTVGMWGEWHYGDGQMLPHWASTNSQGVFMRAYTNAFTKTKLLFRYPTGTNFDAGGVATYQSSNLPFGYYDDSFMYSTIGTNNNSGPSWDELPQMNIAGIPNNWKQFPWGGEPRSSYVTCCFSNPPCYGSPQQPDQSWSNCVYQSHTTFIHEFAVFYTIDLYHFGVYYYGPGGTNALLGARQLGYELWAQSYTATANSGTLNCSVTVTNTGVAPFYYNWKVQLAALTNGVIARTWDTPWHLTDVVPGDGSVTWSMSTNNAPVGSFILAMRAVNPMSNGRQLKFANSSQDSVLANWLTLGIGDTTSPSTMYIGTLNLPH